MMDTLNTWQLIMNGQQMDGGDEDHRHSRMVTFLRKLNANAESVNFTVSSLSSCLTHKHGELAHDVDLGN